MSPEPPPPAPRRPRPEAGGEGEGEGDRTPGSDGPAAPELPRRRESLAESLARIPDLRPGELQPLVEPVVPPPAPRPATRSDRSAPSSDRPPAPAPPRLPKLPPVEARRPSPGPGRPTPPSARSKDAPKAPPAEPAAPATPAAAPATPGAPPATPAAAPAAAVPSAPVDLIPDRKVPTDGGSGATSTGAGDVEAPATGAIASTPSGAPVAVVDPTVAVRKLRRPTRPVDAEAPLAPEPEVIGRRRRTEVARPAPVAWWRRAGFAATIVVLAAAIPVLSIVGFRIIGDSTEGQFTDSATTPSDPGYEAQVVPTPTAVAIQYGPDGLPTSATFLSLSGGADGPGGGAVIFIPLDTEPAVAAYGVNRIRYAYTSHADDPARAQSLLVGQVGRLLNVGIDEAIRLDDDLWTQLVAPVGPLAIDYGDAVDLGDSTVIPSGPTELAPDQVGAYLSASSPEVSDLSRLDRQAVVWKAWLAAIAASDRPDAVPGETSSGIGRFARRLADGPVKVTTLPVTAVPDGKGRFTTDDEAMNDLVTDAVPSPNPGSIGQRFTVRLLNGVAADAIPADLASAIVHLRGSISIIGNGPSFGTEETSVVYRDPARKGLAQLVLAALGGEGGVRLDRKAPDTIDLTIVLGRDILGDAPVAGSPGSTTPETTGGS